LSKIKQHILKNILSKNKNAKKKNEKGTHRNRGGKNMFASGSGRYRI
jgi:hypothetical protein